MSEHTPDWKRVAHVMTGALMPLIGPEKAQKILAEAIEACPDETAPDLMAALQAVREMCIPGMNWTDEIGQKLLALADEAIRKAKATT